jgi:simple sugar transport system permease protein
VIRVRRFARLAAVPTGAIVLAFLVGAVVLIVSSPLVTGGLDFLLPIRTYGALLQGSLLSFNAIVDTVVNAAPLILVGLGVGLGFKAGLFNIGGQGQFLVGALAAAGTGAVMATASPFLAVPAALGAAVLAGAMYGFIPGFLKAYTGAHEVVTTIMLNYIAFQLVGYAIAGPLRAPGADFARSRDVGNAALVDIINQGTGHEGHIGILIPLLVVPAIWWLLFRSTVGFEIRTVGANPDAARYAGMKPRRMVILALTLGGLLAGVAGALEILGRDRYMAAAYSTNIGYEALTVALLGRAHPVGIVFGGLLLGGMRAGGAAMQSQAGIPIQMIDLLQGVILFFLAAELVVRRVFRIRSPGAGVDELQTVTRTYSGQTTAP